MDAVSSTLAPPASSDIKDPTRIHLIKFLTILESLEWILANPGSKEPPFGLDDALLVDGKKNSLAAAVMQMVPRTDNGVVLVQWNSEPVDVVVKRLLTPTSDAYPVTGTSSYNFAISMKKNVTDVASLNLGLKISPSFTTVGISFMITSHLQTPSNDSTWNTFRQEGLKGFRPLAQNWKSRFLAEASLIIRADPDSSTPPRQFYCLIHESKQGSTYTRHLSSVEITSPDAKIPDISVPADENELPQSENKKRKRDDSVQQASLPPELPNPPPIDAMDISPSLPSALAPVVPPTESVDASVPNKPAKTGPAFVFDPTSQDVANVVYQYDEMFAILCNVKDGESQKYGRLILAIPTPQIQETYTFAVEQGQAYQLVKVEGNPLTRGNNKSIKYPEPISKRLARLVNDSDVEEIYGVQGSLKKTNKMTYIIFDAGEAGDYIGKSLQTGYSDVLEKMGYSRNTNVTRERVFWLFKETKEPTPIIAILPGPPPRQVTDIE